MKTLIDLITEQVTNAFTGQGYDAKYGKVTLSNRPDLCEYQCNGAMAAAKEYKCAPFMISDKIAQALAENELFKSVESVKPGFINMKVSPAYLAKYVSDMKADEGRFGCDKAAHPKTIIVDYGGANVAKPLHVGHLRSAVIGESIKRIGKFMGHHMIGDVHLGDWGLQMGLIIVELKERKPDLVYYDESYTGEYPKEAPFTISELEDIYPTASKKSKEDEAFREAAMEATSQLQAGRRGYRALLAHILDVSVTDLKKNYDNLSVSFELWKGESDAQPYIPDMVQMMKDKGLTYEKDGALWFKSTEYGDDKDRVLRKSDGTLAYLTPDIANHMYKVERGYEKLIDLWGADHHSYVTRMQCALKACGLPEDTLTVDIIQMVRMVEDGEEVKMSKRTGNAIMLRELCEDLGTDAARWFFVSKDVATQMDLDLKLARTKDMNNPVFYAQYAYSRMHSILTREGTPEFEPTDDYSGLTDAKELRLMKLISEFPKEVADDARDRKPNKMTEYIMDFVKTYHSYYNSVRVLTDDPELTNERLGLTKACMVTLKNALHLVGVSAPEKM